MLTHRRLITFGLAFCALSADATVIVSGTHLDITGLVTEPISIVNGGSVTVFTNGEIVAPPQSVSGTGTVTVQGGSTLAQRSVFEMQGNSSLTSTQGVPLMLRHLATARLSDDAQVVGSGVTAIQSNNGNRSTQLLLEDRATVAGNVWVDGTISIADDARITGQLASVNGTVALAMSGGSIEGGVSLANAGDYNVTISGGRIDNGFRFGPSSVSTFEMTGGEIHGGFTSLGQLGSASISGGSIFGGLELSHFSPLTIFGGVFEATAGDWLVDIFNVTPFASGSASILSIYGGQFGYADAGNGIRLSGIGGLDIYGYDLTFVNGLLSGYLSDGNWLSLSVFTEANWTGAINLHNSALTSVPEPSTALLLFPALAAMFGARRFTSRPAQLSA